MDTWGSARKDVVERACGNCGTRFPSDDPACPNCFRPVTAAYSRWRGGPTSFGLSGKLAIAGTLVAFAIGNFVYWVSALGRYGWPRALEISLILLLPIPFLFRRTRIR
ncbi:MAG: hypothetical protein ACRDGW_11225 [Actinomycetota bacterium]